MEAGVRIYRYPRPLVLHAKHFTVDNEVAVIGSSNMDMRSFSLNLEVSVMMLGDHIVEELSDIQDSYRAKSPRSSRFRNGGSGRAGSATSITWPG